MAPPGLRANAVQALLRQRGGYMEPGVLLPPGPPSLMQQPERC